MPSFWENEQQVLIWIVGVVLMLAGAGLFHFATRVAGLLVGAACGAVVGFLCSLVLNLKTGDPVMLAVAGIFVIAGILLGQFFLKFSLRVTFGIAGLVSGLLLARLGCEMFGAQPFAWSARTVLIIIASGIAGAILCALWQRLVVIIFSAIIGAALATRGMTPMHEYWLGWGAGMALLSVLWQGILVHFLFDKNKKENDND